MTRPPKVNIDWIARQAGVSKSTVSRVLNGGSVSPALQERIQTLIRTSGFRPSLSARNFSKGRTGCIGLVVPTFLDAWLPQILQGVEEETNRHQLSLLLGSLGEETAFHPEVAKDWIEQRRVDGLIFASSGKRELPLIQEAQKSGLGLVFITGNQSEGLSQIIRCDNLEGGRKAGQHLLAFGHKRFAFVGGREGEVDPAERLEGFLEVLRAAGIKKDQVEVQYSGWRTIHGESAAKQWMARRKANGPTAFFCANDSVALGFLRVVLQAGLRVPQDVSVVGFDDVPTAQVFWPGLTTVRQDMRVMGAAAVRALVEQIETPGPKPTIFYPGELVVRESSGPAPG